MWFKNEKCNKNFLRPKNYSQSVYELRLAKDFVGTSIEEFLNCNFPGKNKSKNI